MDSQVCMDTSLKKINMRKIILPLLLLCFFFQLSAQPAANPTIQQARQLIQELTQRDEIPGLSISVSKEGQLLWSEGFGYADLEQRVPVYPDKTKFRIGSVSKPLTAVALALLYEQGKINLDVAIQRYVSDFPAKRDTFTLRQLAGHLAGIRHYKGDEFMYNKYYPTVAEGLDIFKNDPLLHQPGSKDRYSSYGWNLISAAVENAAGVDFLDYMQQQVFDPINLNQTYPERIASIIPFRSRYYANHPDNGQVINAPAVDNSYKWAGGGFIATSEDLIKFGNALLDNLLLKAATLQEFIRSQQTTDGQSTHYGMGFRSGTDSAGHSWFGHSGGSVGGITQFVIYPEQKVVVAIVTNASRVRYGKLPYELARLFF